jgi:hypothetical protein
MASNLRCSACGRACRVRKLAHIPNVRTGALKVARVCLECLKGAIVIVLTPGLRPKGGVKF